MKFLSLTLATLAGMLISTHALPGPLPKLETSTLLAEFDVDEVIPSINATEHNLAARDFKVRTLSCFRDPGKWAADTQHPFREVGKNYDLAGKNMAEVARQFCAEVSGHTFTAKEVESVEKHYWFKNTWEGFPRPFVPVRISVVNFHSTPGKLTFKDCTEKMTKVISGCTAKGKPSRKDFFRGGFVTGDDKIAYSIHCAEKYCL